MLITKYNRQEKYSIMQSWARGVIFSDLEEKRRKARKAGGANFLELVRVEGVPESTEYEYQQQAKLLDSMIIKSQEKKQ